MKGMNAWERTWARSGNWAAAGVILQWALLTVILTIPAYFIVPQQAGMITLIWGGLMLIVTLSWIPKFRREYEARKRILEREQGL
jgi:hypothetical protein